MFCKQNHLKYAPTRSALEQLILNDYVGYSDNVRMRSKVLVKADKNVWNQLDDMPASAQQIFQGLMRMYEGILRLPTEINEEELAKFVSLKKRAVTATLRSLDKDGFIEYRPSIEKSVLWFKSARLRSENVIIPEKKYWELRDHKLLKAKSVLAYLKTDVCRQSFLAEYFGEIIKPCGHCDSCLNKKGGKKFREELLNLLANQKKNFTLDELIANFERDLHEQILNEILLLESEEIIHVDEQKIVTLERTE